MERDQGNGDYSPAEREEEYKRLEANFKKVAQDILSGRLSEEQKQRLVKNLSQEELFELQRLLREEVKDKNETDQ